MNMYKVFTNDRTDTVCADYYLYNTKLGIVEFYKIVVGDNVMRNTVACYVLRNIVGFRKES